MNPAVEGLVEQGRAALAAGDAGTARASFEAAVVADECGATLEGLASALHMDDEYGRASRDAFERAYGAYRIERDAVGAYRCARMVAFFHGAMSGEWAMFHGWLHRAAALLEEIGGDLERGRRELLLGQHLGGGTDAEKDSHFREGLAIGRLNHDANLEFQALAYLGNHLVHTDRVEEGMAMLDEALAGVCAGEVTDNAIVDEIFCLLLASCERAHDVTRADQWMRAARDASERLNLGTMAALCRAHYGGVLTAAGRWVEADRELLASLRGFERGARFLQANASTRLADLRVRQGRLEDAAILLKDVEENPDAARPLAALHLARGELALARDRIDRVLDAPGVAAAVAAPLLALLVDVELAAGDTPSASAAADRLSALAASRPIDYLVACAALARGKVCLAAGSGDPRACLIDALAAFSRAGMPVELARARLELAKAVAGERPEVAVAEATAALEAFERLAAAPDADAAAALLRSLGMPTRPGARIGAVLTRREAEVLDLLGHGLSNAEIAKRLYISPKTVEHHVGRVLAKLGLRTRAEAAAHAARR